MSFSTRTKKNVRNIGGVSAVALAAALLLTPVASTANFSASGGGTVDANSATLSLGLTDDKSSVGTFDLDFNKLAPGGDVQHQKVYVTNTGDIPAVAKFSLTLGKGAEPIRNSAVVGVNAPAPDASKLLMGVSGITSLVPYKSLPVTTVGTIAPGETKAFTLDGALDKSAGNEWQNVSVSTKATVTLEQQ